MEGGNLFTGSSFKKEYIREKIWYGLYRRTEKLLYWMERMMPRKIFWGLKKKKLFPGKMVHELEKGAGW